MTSCLIVEDHDLMAEGILQAATGADLSPIRRARTLFEALQGDAADVILLDLSLPDSCRLDTVSAVLEKWPYARILVLSADVDLDHALMLLRRGVLGVIGKEVSVEHLRSYVNSMTNGGWAITPEVAGSLNKIEGIDENLSRLLAEVSVNCDFSESAELLAIPLAEANAMLLETLEGSGIPLLTPAQLRVLLMVEAGMSNKAAASSLGVGIKTVERHLRDIRKRMHLPEREPRQLGAFAQRLHRGCLLTLEEHIGSANPMAIDPIGVSLDDENSAGTEVG
jgi:two-component system, NarL family, response regulator DegU